MSAVPIPLPLLSSPLQPLALQANIAALFLYIYFTHAVIKSPSIQFHVAGDKKPVGGRGEGGKGKKIGNKSKWENNSPVCRVCACRAIN